MRRKGRKSLHLLHDVWVLFCRKGKYGKRQREIEMERARQTDRQRRTDTNIETDIYRQSKRESVRVETITETKTKLKTGERSKGKGVDRDIERRQLKWEERETTDAGASVCSDGWPITARKTNKQTNA